jgi:hypothetical protein
MDADKELSFVTVTSHEKLNAKQSVKVLPNSWHKLSMRLRRRVKGLQYVTIPERHKSGRIHVHGIFDSVVGTRWWKDNARECGMGFQAEEDLVYSASGAGFYMGKYLFKQLSDERWAKNFRRIRTSLYYPKLPPLIRDSAWVFEPLASHADISSEAAFLQTKGYRVALADHATAWALVEKFTEVC